ncbi:hypothetical protein KFD70_26885 [Bacillus pfraonensis]|uniref:tubby C-terminal domain-like protein n=1 Tax=Bacillus TaxID=1386 RepID=UPI00035E760B|nr:hypothetical protein [Bacillus bingmayongensis]MBY0596278.1 hypothetical protein [Bacillus bingmayongensis]
MLQVLFVFLVKPERSFFLSGDYFVQFDVFTNDGQLHYQVKKIPRWGKTQYSLIDHKTSKTYSITYESWQVISPELLIKSDSCELTVKKAPMDWAKFYYRGKEVARWRMKTSEWFKTYLEIEEDSPIQEPEFFTGIAQILFYVGE